MFANKRIIYKSTDGRIARHSAMASPKPLNQDRPLLLCLAQGKQDIEYALVTASDAKSPIWHTVLAYQTYFPGKADFAKQFMSYKLRVPVASSSRCVLLQNLRSSSYVLHELSCVYDTINDLAPASAPYAIVFVVLGDAAGGRSAEILGALEPELGKWRALCRSGPRVSSAMRYYIAQRDRELAAALAAGTIKDTSLTVPGGVSADEWMSSMIRAVRAAEPGPLRVLLDGPSRDACVAVGFNVTTATDVQMPMVLAAGGMAGTLKSSTPDGMCVYLLSVPLY